MSAPRRQNDTICPHCGNDTFKQNPIKGEYSCSKCGYVSPHAYIDTSLEVRTFQLEHGVKNRERASGIDDDFLTDLSTTFAYDAKPATKKAIELTKRLTEDAAKTRLRKVINGIKRICRELELPYDVTNRACSLYVQATEKNIKKKQRSEAFAAACIFISCKENRVGKQEDVIAQHCSTVTIRDIQQAVESLKSFSSDSPMRSEDVAKEYALNLRLKEPLVNAIFAVAETARMQEVATSKKISTVAAAAILYTIDCLLPAESPLRATIPDTLHEDLQGLSGVTLATIQKTKKEFSPLQYDHLEAVQELVKYK